MGGRVPTLLRIIEMACAKQAMEERDRYPLPTTAVTELAIRHDDWCMSQRPGTHKWCNCEPDFRLVAVESPERLAEIAEDEKTRRGLNQPRDN